MDVASVVGRRFRKIEIADEVGTENTAAIYDVLQRRTNIKRVHMKSDAVETIVCKKLCRLISKDDSFSPRTSFALPGPSIGVLSTPNSIAIRKILWAFHTNWILRKTAEDRTRRTDVCKLGKTFQIEWVTDFFKYFTPLWQQFVGSKIYSISFDPDFGPVSIFGMQVRVIVDLAAKEITKMTQRHFNASSGMNIWSDTINTAIEHKDVLLEKFETEHLRLLNLDANLDEGSIWGLKPLRRCLAPPYYKTPDGMAAAPAHPNTSNQVKIGCEAFFNFNKQKWTTQDLKALKDAIRQVIVEKRLLEVQMAADILLKDCEAVHDMRMSDKLAREAMGETVNEAEEQPKRRGRRKKFGKSPFLGEITPHLFTIKSPVGDIVVRYKTNNNYIEDWRDKCEDNINKPKLEELLRLGYDKPRIDWLYVSNKVTHKTKKNRSAEDCWLAFTQEAHPKIVTKRWSASESAQFQALIKLHTPEKWDKRTPICIDWDSLNTSMGFGRTPFQLFYRWRNIIAPPKKMSWTAQHIDDATVNTLIKKNEGNWKKVAIQCGTDLATKKQIIDRYKKNSNVKLKAGSFTRVEDALLLLTIEKLKGHLIREGHFGELIAYLPWRFETVWRDRAGNLFADWIVPWKIEEDKRLLELAQTTGRNWRKIAESFNSFKNRKGCLTRWKILQRRLKTCKGVEEYHEAYSMIRYNIFQYKHLKEVLNLLKNVYKEPVSPFSGFSSAKSPEDVDLQDFLLSFNRIIMASAIKALDKYITARDAYGKEWLNTHGEKKRTFDRRKFYPDNPQSMASALHIRGIALKPRGSFPASKKLDEFQTQVYSFYAQFCKTKALKKDAKRPYLPEKRELIAMESVQAIINVPTKTIEKAKKEVALGLESCAKKRKPYQRTSKNAKKRGPAKKKGPPAKRGRKRKMVETSDSDTPPDTEMSDASESSTSFK